MANNGNHELLLIKYPLIDPKLIQSPSLIIYLKSHYYYLINISNGHLVYFIKIFTYLSIIQLLFNLY